MKEFRIVTDGIRFKTQVLKSTGWWIWKRDKWFDLGRWIDPWLFVTDYYPTIEAAERKLATAKMDLAALHHGWIPVDETKV